MATNIGTLMIGVRGDVAALHADVQSMNVIVRRGFDQMGADMRRAEQAGRQFNEQMRGSAVAVRNVVTAAAGLSGLSSITGVLSQLPREGIKYTASMETMQLGIAGTLASMGQMHGKAIDIGQAMQISSEVTGRLQQKAMETSANMHELVGAYQAIIGPGLQAGATLTQMVDFVSAGVNAVKSLGLNSTQVVQELRDLVQGGIQPASSTLATALGLSDKDIKEAKAKGEDLIAMLMDRMKGFEATSVLYGQTFTGQLTAMQEAIHKVAGLGMEPITDALKEGMRGVMETLGSFEKIAYDGADGKKKELEKWTVDPAVVVRIQETTSSVVAFSKSTLSAASAAMEYKDVLLGLAGAYAAVKASQIVGGGVDLAKEKIGAMVAERNLAKATLERAMAEQQALGVSLRRAEADAARGASLTRMAQLEVTAARQNLAAASTDAERARYADRLAQAEANRGAAIRFAAESTDRARSLNQAAAASAQQLAEAHRGVERTATASGLASRAGGAIIGALGGPIGIAITGLSMLAIWWGNSASAAEESARRQEKAIGDIQLALAKDKRDTAMAESAKLTKEYEDSLKKASAAEDLYKQRAGWVDGSRYKRSMDEAKAAAKTAYEKYKEGVDAISKWDMLKNKDAMHGVSQSLKMPGQKMPAKSAGGNISEGFTGQDQRMFRMVAARSYGEATDLDAVKPRFSENYKSYMEGEGLTTTKAEDRAKKLEKENQRFALALKDVEEGSAKHAELLQLHKDRIAKINKEDKEGAGKGARSLPVDIRALADEEARLQQVRAQIEQVRKSGLAKPDMTDGEKAAEKYRQEAAAARELGKASLAAAKDKLAARAVVRGEAERELKELERANQLRLEFTQADEKRAADLKIANEEAENEYKWLALSNEERAAAQAAWEVEKKARQEILDLQKQQREATTAELKDQLASRIEVVRSQAEEDKITAAARARRQSSLQEWGQISGDIERALTDSITRGFDGGMGSMENFKKALLNIPKTFMVRLLVQPMMNEINSLGAQLLAGQSGVGGAAGGLSLDSLMGLGKMAGKAGDGLSWLGDALGMDSLKSLGGSLNNLMGGANSAGAALEGVGSFLGSGSAYGAANSLSGFTTGLEGASAGLSGWTSGLQGSAGSFAGLNNTVSSLTQNSAAFDSLAAASSNSVATGAGGASAGASSLSTYAGYASAAYNLFNSIKTGKGWGSTIGSAAYLIPGIGPIAGTIGTLLGGLADSAFGHKGGPKTGGNANAVFDSSGNVVAREMFGGYTPDQLDKSMRDQISALQTSYAGLTKALGGTVRGLTINLGGDQDPQGKAGNRVSAQIAFDSVGVGAASVGDAERALWDKALYSSVSKGVGGDFDAALKLEVSRMLVAAVRGSDLPDEVAKIFSSVDLSAASQDQLDVLIAQAQALASLNNAFKALAPILPQLSGLSLDAKRALTDLAGGLDQFVSNTANWRANFYSKAEQDNATRKALADDLAKVGVALPATREEYRRLVEQMDITSEKGREAWTVMMKLSSGFASVTLSAEELAKQLQSDFSTAAGLAAKSLAAAQAADKGRLAVDQWLAEANGNAQAWNDKRRAALWGMYATAAPEQQLELLQELQGLMKERYQTEIDAVSGLVSDANRLKDAAKSLRDYVDGLRVGDLSPLTMGQRLAESAQQFADTLSKAQGGDKEALSALQGKASTYLGLGRDYYASSAPYSGSGGIFEQVTGSLSALGVSLDGMASGQLTAAQTAAAQAQYSAAALAEMTRLRDGFGALNSTLMQQTQRQASDAAAILLKMKDDEALAALKALPAELAAIIKGELSSLERSPYTGGSAKDVAFSDLVSGAYRSILQREPDQPGFQYWLDRLSSGALSPDAFSRQFVTEAVNYGERGGQWQPSIDRATAWAGKFFPDIVPQFAVGTNELPADMLAMVHAGERIIPAADNAELFAKLDEPSQMAGGMAALASKVDQLVGLVGELILTLQQHGTLTSAASHDAAQEVVLAVESASKEAQWLARSAPMLT